MDIQHTYYILCPHSMSEIPDIECIGDCKKCKYYSEDKDESK